jgi:hypothetical protein
MDAVGRLVLDILLLFGLVCKIAEDIVQNEVAIGLLGENEGLRETLVGLALVGDFADDLDNDVRVGALGIDVGDADFGVLVVEILDALVDGLFWSASLHSLVHSVIPSVLRIRPPSPLRRPRRTASAYCRRAVPKVSRVLHNNTNWCSVTYVESVRALAESGIVLLYEVPADLILGDLSSRLLCRLAGRWLLRGSEVGGAGRVAVLVGLRRIVAVDRARGFGGSHFDDVKWKWFGR